MNYAFITSDNSLEVRKFNIFLLLLSQTFCVEMQIVLKLGPL